MAKAVNAAQSARSEQAEAVDRTVPDEYRACRGYRHAWDPFGALRVQIRGHEVVQTIQCMRCPTEKDIAYNPLTHESRTIGTRYPEDYVFKEGGRFTTKEVDELRWSAISGVVGDRVRKSQERRKKGEAADPEVEQLAQLIELKPRKKPPAKKRAPRKTAAVTTRRRTTR